MGFVLRLEGATTICYGADFRLILTRAVCPLRINQWFTSHRALRAITPIQMAAARAAARRGLRG